ncbi:TraR/DksA C4-type zinc finger protein [Bacillus marinisedimentorum]|uniref:TraR/DksA C4-type zinc finger protein n=1 Tax=Bacillus marinisedimentorum TaxID=1821260 RepID=UPI000872A241|nr:TraR/DksA C4-type zinc finger protein [Bacillus marinisedimentorum]
MLTDKQLQGLRSQLTALKNDAESLLRDSDHYGLDQEANKWSVGELANYDNHPGDIGTELYEREKDIALNDLTEKQLEEAENALQRMEDGTYGVCTVCGKEIPFERLHAIPTASRCKEHADDQTVARQRPIEEGALGTPFYSYTNESADDGNYFDAEDSFQRVGMYGTSETPSDFGDPNMADYNQMYIGSEDTVGFTESLENFISTDITGSEVNIVPTKLHEKYEDILDAEEQEIYNRVYDNE